MEEEVKKDILVVWRKVYSAVKKCDADAMKFASDHTLHNSSMYQDKHSISIAIIVYSLYKICTRERVVGDPNYRKFNNDFLEMISEAQSNLAKNRIKEYERIVKKMFTMISKLEKKFGKYITQVINQSRIKKGGRVVEHGLSVGRAAELLGVTSWELQAYIGKTKISDVEPISKGETLARMKMARRIFHL